MAAALAADGFRPRVRAEGISFHGAVDLRGASIPVRLDYATMDFSLPPSIVVDAPEKLGERVVPHLDEAFVLCAFSPREHVVDRYSAPQQARGLVARAAQVLEEGLHSKSVSDIAAEFPAHWGGPTVGIAFGPGACRLAEAFPDDRGKMNFRLPAQPLARNAKHAAAVLRPTTTLSFRQGERRPETVGEAVDWANSWEPGLGDTMRRRLAELSPDNPFVLLYAPNGIVGFEVMVSSRGPVLHRRLTSRGWSKLLVGRFGLTLPIRRVRGQRVDMEYILGTNSVDGVAPLAGKSVVVVGCGAIGGHLGSALSQLGAGLSGGSLTLIDDERLDNRNIARHRLGSNDIGREKSAACRDEIQRALPGLNVLAVARKVQHCRANLGSADLVIDATGEQAVGDLLNEWRLEGVESFALLHVWVEGNGAAVQSYFSSDPAFGCYRCLQPHLSSQPRYPVLRADADRALVTGCGEAPFNPYGPTAPLAAAALAAQHAIDWAVSRPRPLLRTFRLSIEQTQERKPTNPTRSPSCPACGSMQ